MAERLTARGVLVIDETMRRWSDLAHDIGHPLAPGLARAYHATTDSRRDHDGYARWEQTTAAAARELVLPSPLVGQYARARETEVP